MSNGQKLSNKQADHERRKALWKARTFPNYDKEDFRQSILKISSDIDSIFYGYRKILRHKLLD